MSATLLPTQTLNIDSGYHFYIENHDATRTLQFMWDNRPYAIPPGKKKLVPFEVVALYFGDPRSRVGMIQQFKDSTGAGKVPERHAEVQRLCVRYGVYEQGMDDIRGALTLLQAEARANGKPALRDENFSAVITTDTGEPIITPLFDHEGTESSYSFELDDERSDDVATILNQMKKRIEYLEAKKDILDESGDNEDEGIDFDNPSDLP
jgi:hypothetical protein